MSCNPAVGGIAKGQIVREIDALGGQMGLVTDETAIQFRILNRSKGPAMWSPRAQCDRAKFIWSWRERLENTPNLHIWQDTVCELLVENGEVTGLVTVWGVTFKAKCIVLTAGTFLNGLMHVGRHQLPGGRMAEPASYQLTESIARHGITYGRMKTGTPVRIDARSVHFDQMETQDGECDFHKFSFMGKKARVLNELLSHEGLRESLDYNEEQKRSNLECLHKTQERLHRQLEFRKKTLQEHPLLSDKYRYYTEQELRYDAASTLMQRRFSVDRNKQEHLEDEFMNYINSVFYPHPVHPYTLLRGYNSFMRDYIGYIDDTTPSSNSLTLTPQNMERLYFAFEAEGKVRLSEEEKNALRSFSKYQEEIEKLQIAKADSATIKDYTKEQETVIKPQIEIIEQLIARDGLLNEYMTGQMYVNAINNSMAIIDSLQMDKDLREILKTKCYYEMLQYTHKELPDSLISKFKKEVTNPSLQSYVLVQQQKYDKVSHKTIEHPESLMPNAPLEGITDGEQLFRKIIEPYKGKVIYLDIWGTWCGPCKDMMQYAGNIKNLFAGKEVVFLYLCNHSTDKSWKNIIKEYGLTSKSSVHYNLPDKQQSAIEKYLGVHSFPTYMLIDKEGNIVNRKAPRPTMENQLLNAVYKELEK